MKLVIDGGDGDQTYFSQPLVLEKVERDWFSGSTPHGEALLFEVVGGIHHGKYLALASRVLSGVETQLKERNSASVVVQVVSNFGPGFKPTLANLDAIGMAFAEAIED